MSPWRRWRRWRPRRPRLGTQLVALVLALLAVSFALVAVVTAVALHDFLLQRLDEQLQAAGDRFSVGLEHPDDDHDADDRDVSDQQLNSVAGQAVGTLGARVKGGVVTAAAVVGHDSDDPTTKPGSAVSARLATLAVAAGPRTIHLPGLGPYRVLVQNGDDGDVLITGLPERPVDDTIERLVRIEAVVFGGAAVLVGVTGALFVRLSLRPLNRVAETATRVADLPLSSGTVTLVERAPQPEAHTEVGRLAGAVNHMLEHVESSLTQRQASEERLRRFVADASHELRTPVAVIRSHAELAGRTGAPLPPDVAHALTRIDRESARMGHLVDDLLLLARLDSGRPLARDDVDLTRIALDAVSDARVAGADHRWQLDLPEEPVSVRGDGSALHQVVANLLANARAHTPAGTSVVTTVRTGPDGVELVVADDGPGIPTGAQPWIFERFTRADDDRAAATGSSGLGLAIVQAIVREHGGRVELVSEPGATRFTVTLPV